MAYGEVGPPIAELRAAAASSVSGSSLRQVAREVGMTPSGLKKFLNGSTPYSATRRKLNGWYVREGHSAITPYAAQMALDVVVTDLPPGERLEGVRCLLAALEKFFAEKRRPTPSWLTQVLEDLDRSS